MSSQTVMTVCEEMDGAGNTKNFPQSAKCMHLAGVGGNSRITIDVIYCDGRHTWTGVIYT